MNTKNTPLRMIGTALAVLLLFSAPALWSGGQQESGTEVISFAGSGGYPPFNYLTENGDVVGFDVDVAQEIADRMGKTMEYKTTAWDGIIEGLRAKRYDGILGSMGITAQRQEIVNFSDPYYYSGPQLIVRKDSGITSIADLGADAKIGLVTGTTFEADAAELEVEVKLYEDDNQTLIELLNGRVDGVLTDRIVGLNAIGELSRGSELTTAGSVLRSEMMGIAFHKDDTALLEEVNGILEEMRADGTLAAISAHWFNGEDITRK